MNTGNVLECVGNTPLILLKHLSEATGCAIYGKAEFLNPGGSVKDRAARGILKAAIADGRIKVGTRVIEGTAGNTGIGLATLAAQLGLSCTVVMPNNQAEEKYSTLRALGVELVTVDPCPFANPNHFYHRAKALAEEIPNSFWANQFENTDNYKEHEQTTALEIWEQTKGSITAFVAASGTGGTIAGVSRGLKAKNKKVEVTLADPMGSGLYSFLNTGEIKSQGSSITEGIGIMRLTENFKQAQIDQALQIDDQSMLNTLYYLAKHEGLLVGTSAALNVHAAFVLAKRKKGQVIVTVLCDSALRYQSRVFNPTWLKEKGLTLPSGNL